MTNNLSDRGMRYVVPALSAIFCLWVCTGPVFAQTMVATVAGLAGMKGSSDGVGSSARLDEPRGITGDGRVLYIADTNNNVIRKLDLSTGMLSTIAGRPGPGGHKDGPASQAIFDHPGGVVKVGNSLFVSDALSSTIRKLDLENGKVSTVAGKAFKLGDSDGIGSSALFFVPFGMATDGKNLFIADSENHTIRMLTLSSGQVTTIAGIPGEAGHQDGAGKTATFYDPVGLATDGRSLFIADGTNCEIRKYDFATGLVSTLAGRPRTMGDDDGIGSKATFYAPVDLTISDGNLFVVDAMNHTIRKIVISTLEVSTLSGSPKISGHEDGPVTVATFNLPFGIVAIEKALYVTEVKNCTVRVIK